MNSSNEVHLLNLWFAAARCLLNLLSIKSCYSHGASRCRHAGHIVPLPGLRVPALHRVEVTPAVMAAHSVHRPLQHGNTCTVSKQEVAVLE